jgi:hypothetical protein
MLEGVPFEWYAVDFLRFSGKKVLFDHQREALESAVRGLYCFYGLYGGRKEEFFESVYSGVLSEVFPVENRRAIELLSSAGFEVSREGVYTY